MPSIPKGGLALSGHQKEQKTINLSGLAPANFDHITLTYVSAGNGAGEIETVVYRQGGASGNILTTLTLGYDGSNKLSTITKT